VVCCFWVVGGVLTGRVSVRFRFFDALDGWSTEEDGPGLLNARVFGVVCSVVRVGTFMPRGRNVLSNLKTRGVISISSASSSEEVSGERSDSSSTRPLPVLRSGVTEPVNSLSTSSIESAIDDRGVKDRDISWIAACGGLMVGYSPDRV
jgi:hypothetical protein